MKEGQIRHVDDGKLLRLADSQELRGAFNLRPIAFAHSYRRLK